MAGDGTKLPWPGKTGRFTYGGFTAVHVAASYNNVDALRFLLLACGADPDPRDAGGWTPLFRACAHGHAEAARFLLAHGGADPSAQTEKITAALGARFPAGTTPHDACALPVVERSRRTLQRRH